MVAASTMAESEDELQSMLQVVLIEGTEEYIPPSAPRKIPLSERRMEIITTHRKGQMLVVDERYLYRKGTMSKKGVTSWRCWRHDPPINCSGRARTSNGRLIEYTRHDGHEHDEYEVAKRKKMTEEPKSVQEHPLDELEQIPNQAVQTSSGSAVVGGNEDDKSDLVASSSIKFTSHVHPAAKELVDCIILD